jgi:alpha-2-macroglobulin
VIGSRKKGDSPRDPPFTLSETEGRVERVPTLAKRGQSPFFLFLLLALPAFAQDYQPADLGQRPAGGGVRILPETFLRGFDPVTVYFSSDQVSAGAKADDGSKRLKIAPEWPGAYVWVDRRTLQFRPAEPWPALARFSFQADGAQAVLTTMMSAPSSMVPSAGSVDLRPFRVVTLTFPQALPITSLKKMISVELRELPGLADSPRKKLDRYALAQLPRASHRDPATYALTLDEDVPEGHQLVVSAALALGNEGTTLWQGRASTRPAFGLTEIRCGSASFAVQGGASTPRDLALSCGNGGDAPVLVFSAPVRDLSLSSLKKLVRLEPAVPDLRFSTYGSRVQLLGRFVPDTLYAMSLGPAEIKDDSDRPLREVKPATVYFHLGWKAAFLKWNLSNAIVEAKGPRMLPLTGYGDPRADVRIHRVDALHTGLWPFPESPVVIDEQSAPPFPGEEPARQAIPGGLDANTLKQHLRLLGSPLVSRVVDLPLAQKGGTTQFGLDLKALLAAASGEERPGTYLVGLRRLTGKPERTWVRVQVTNLTVTAVEERDKVALWVRTLDSGAPVRGATVLFEGTARTTGAYVSAKWNTDDQGRINVTPLYWSSINRVSVTQGDDVLVLNPNEGPPRFSSNHWSASSHWLQWLCETVIPKPVNDVTLGFIFTERPIYKPGESVFVKAYLRNKVGGELTLPREDPKRKFGLAILGPDGQEWKIPTATSALMGFAGEFKESNTPTGEFTAILYEGTPDMVLARRPFKVEAYRIPTFEVQLTGANRVRLDQAFKVKAVARYYAGGYLGGQPIDWTVTQRPWHWVPQGLPGFLFASSTQFSRPSRSGGADTTRQKAELTDDGAHELTLHPELDLDGSARVYRFEATVTGPDDQPVTGYTEVKALPAFVLGLKLPRYLEKATSLPTELVAVGIDEKPLAGQEVKVKLLKRVWHSTLRETSFATGQPKYVTEQEDVAMGEQTVTTKGEPLKLELAVKDAGVYVVELIARDKLGRVQTISADLYIGGGAPMSWQKSRDGVFDLKSDKPTYAPGQVAHIVVQSPYTQARALVVIEEPGGNRYEWKEVSGGKTVVDVPIGDKHVPNLPVHVVLMRGRLGEGKTDDSRYKPATVASSIDLTVDATRNTVWVDVKHPEVAKPGTTQDFVITLADEKKKPMGGEVTLWLVDEAVLSLAKEGPLDPLTAMIESNRRTSSIRDTRNLVIGRLSEQEEEPGGDGSDEDEGKDGKRIVRKNFKTVPYYQATLIVPASGTLKVPIKLSDDLTNFKVRAVAASGATRFGVKQSVIKLRLPVLVQPQAPRFARLGDKFFLGGIARVVEGPDGPAQVDVKVTGPIEGGSSMSEKINLKANKAQPVLVPVTVLAGAGMEKTSMKVRVDVTRLSDKAGDAFEIDLPIYPDRPVEKFAWLDTLKPGATKMKDFPEPARPGTASQTFVLTSQPGLLELAAGLEYLSAYPHGCLEQRMSQLYPDLALGGFLKSLELDTRFTPQMTKNTQRILDDIGLHLDEQGLVSYWPGSRGWVQSTAQSLEFIEAAKKAGVSTDEKMRQRLVESLKRVLRSDFVGVSNDYRYTDQTTALRALSRAGVLDEHYLIELWQQRARMDAASQADLAAAMAEKPSMFAPNLAAMKGELWDSVVFKLVKGNKVFDSIRGDRKVWSYGMLGSRTATTAAVWEALLKLDSADGRHSMLRDALISQGSATTGFGSTYDNRRAIAALGTYVSRANAPGPSISVSLPGAQALGLEGKRIAGRRVLEGDQATTVTVSGGPVGARIAYQYVPKATGDQVAEKKSGFIVSRSVTRMPLDGSAPTHHDDVTGKTLELDQGEVLEVHARLVTDEARNHVALIVPIAAGLEPLNPALENASSDAKPSQADSTTPTYVQRMDNEVRYYFTSLSAGQHTFHFRVRASNPGSFVHPAPWAEMMYREEVRGRGNGMRVVVRPKASTP